MPHPAQIWPDWRHEEQYEPLLGADRSAFAWEWLRRNPGYQNAFEATLGQAHKRDIEERAGRWGLHRFEAPHLPARDARPLWRREGYGYVLPVAAELGGARSDRFDLERFERLATLYTSSSGEEHLLLSDGLRSVRMDIVSGTVLSAPARLHYRLSGFDTLPAPLIVLRQLLALWGTGRFSSTLHPRERRARRWLTMLRAYDGIAAGATQREIAERLLSRGADLPRWRVEAPALRSRAQRLARAARAMAAGGYSFLLESGGFRPSSHKC